MADRLPRRQAPRVLAGRDPAVAAGVRPAVLLVQSVQEVGVAQRTQGVRGWSAVAARRLARPVGHVGADLARRDRARGPGGLTVAGVKNSPLWRNPATAPRV